MHTQLLRFLTFGFLFFYVSASAQKNIILNENLQANSEQFKVKLRPHGNLWKIRFGDYSVISAKGGRTNTSSKSNMTGTKAETKSSNEFSFDLGKKGDVATVKAVNNVNVESLHGLQIFKNFSVGKDEVTGSSNHFLALIKINQDTSDSWTLLMNSEYDATAGSIFEGVLTNGTRKINLTAASSNKEAKNNGFVPALGYQFDESGEYLGAVQYYGGGLLGMNRNIVWMNKGLDPKFELVLAAATTAILQFKITSMGEIEVLHEDE